MLYFYGRFSVIIFSKLTIKWILHIIAVKLSIIKHAAVYNIFKLRFIKIFHPLLYTSLYNIYQKYKVTKV